MKQSRHLLCLATLLISPSWSIESAPFTHAATATTAAAATASILNAVPAAYDLQILKRDGNCPANYNSCSNEGESGICCESGTTCTVDAANHIACCPTGAKCTGTLGATSTTSGFVFPEGTTTTSSSSSTSSTSSAASITGSTIPDAAYPFVYIPTTFENAATCSSYYSLCRSEYTSCVVSLGGQYGVTIGGSGGGVTVEGNSGVTSASAAVSTCSSLSREACYGLQESYCTAYGTSTGSSFVTGSNASARKSSLHEILLAVASGILGMLI
ncbi:hypothetical protein UA08_04621 [Talaromyces atroroseus]|uniref:GPI anchored protein n=1 Tax=Talaromyces atroroseus TaxID=1441469 RepID=A0A225AX70_TALAT|nr:hypothetical protein UA08_04621 [Talaromyces atroroseus]OKL60219.1 hypothetical protein UA08_04621 [Talaromyces atroroseus]